MEILALVSGIATLLGLFLQLRDVFPEHREVRRTTVVLLVGVFFGTLISSFFTLKSTFPASVSTLTVAVCVFLLVICFLVIVACFSADRQKREELFAVAGISGFAVLVLLFFNALGQRPVSDCRLTNFFRDDEVIRMAEREEEEGNFQRAITFLEELHRPLLRLDAREDEVRAAAALGKSIDRIRAKQLKRAELSRDVE